jgi:hypothetical protein
VALCLVWWTWQAAAGWSHRPGYFRTSHEYMFVRLAQTAKVDRVTLDTVGAEIIREVARRILADETGSRSRCGTAPPMTTCSSVIGHRREAGHS